MKRIAVATMVIGLVAAAGAYRPASSVATPTGGIVDSILPPAEALRRFRAGLVPVSELENGARSIDNFMSAFETALQRDDTPALKSLEMTRSEYAYLYFPSSRYASEPYDLPPEIAYMLHTAASEKGLRRLVRRIAGEDFRVDTYRCAAETVEGANRVLHECTVTYRSHGAFATRRLFASLIVRDGRYKILSYANDF